ADYTSPSINLVRTFARHLEHLSHDFVMSGKSLAHTGLRMWQQALRLRHLNPDTDPEDGSLWKDKARENAKNVEYRGTTIQGAALRKV
ncbi:unnamed protein product, partial [Amoebophrya sp. A25]